MAFVLASGSTGEPIVQIDDNPVSIGRLDIVTASVLGDDRAAAILAAPTAGAGVGLPGLGRVRLLRQ